MKRLVCALALIAPTFAAAEEWQALDGAGIRQALEGRTVQYASATQDFRASGRTLYDAGQPSWGYWRVQDDEYCSQWPPSDLWACYRLEKSGDKLRFVGKHNDITEGTYID